MYSARVQSLLAVEQLGEEVVLHGQQPQEGCDWPKADLFPSAGQARLV